MAEPVPQRRQPVAKAQWALAGAGVLMIGAAIWLTAMYRRPLAGTPPPARRAAEAPLALYVQHDGDALRLHWDADAEAVRRASAGTLLIADGPRQSRLHLGPAELRTGVASYWPESPEVDFQLQLDGVPAGEIQAPATAAREEPRPSPFDARSRPSPPRLARPAVEEPDAGEPKPYTVQAPGADPSVPRSGVADVSSAPAPARPAPAPRAVAPAPVPPPAHNADRAANAEPEKPPSKPSRWRRMTRKIPLLRRLGQH